MMAPIHARGYKNPTPINPTVNIIKKTLGFTAIPFASPSSLPFILREDSPPS